MSQSDPGTPPPFRETISVKLRFEFQIDERKNDGTLMLKGDHDNFSRLVLIEPEPQV